MKIERLITNICSEDLEQSKAFYVALFEFTVDYDSDWFVHLVSVGNKLEIGIIKADHEIVPNKIGAKIKGCYITFVVESADALYTKAHELNFKIIQPPTYTAYGQKRMLIEAPEGTIIDVSSTS